MRNRYLLDEGLFESSSLNEETKWLGGEPGLKKKWQDLFMRTPDLTEEERATLKDFKKRNDVKGFREWERVPKQSGDSLETGLTISEPNPESSESSTASNESQTFVSNADAVEDELPPIQSEEGTKMGDLQKMFAKKKSKSNLRNKTITFRKPDEYIRAVTKNYKNALSKMGANLKY